MKVTKTASAIIFTLGLYAMSGVLIINSDFNGKTMMIVQSFFWIPFSGMIIAWTMKRANKLSKYLYPDILSNYILQAKVSILLSAPGLIISLLK